MKIFVVGGGGMLGHKLVQMWRDKFEVWTSLRKDNGVYKEFGIFDPKRTVEHIDVADTRKVEEIIGAVKPDVIVNAVGVVKQISQSRNVVDTLQINSIFPHLLKEIAAQNKCRLINISTDCVFSGLKGNYTEDDAADAADLYGRSKHLGEVGGAGCLTLRTSIIGRELLTGHGLTEWFLAMEGRRIKGYKNAVFSGFPTIVLAGILSDLIKNHPHLEGLYHLSSDPIDKFSLLQLLKDAYKVTIDIEADEDFRVDRSLDSARIRKLTGFQPAEWKRMVDLMANDATVYKQNYKKTEYE